MHLHTNGMSTLKRGVVAMPMLICTTSNLYLLKNKLPHHSKQYIMQPCYSEHHHPWILKHSTLISNIFNKWTQWSLNTRTIHQTPDGLLTMMEYFNMICSRSQRFTTLDTLIQAQSLHLQSLWSKQDA